jgi:hypothetical protein
VDGAGQPVIADRRGRRLLAFDSDWRFSHEIGGPDLFGEPGSMAFGPEGRLAVCDRARKRLVLTDYLGSRVEEIPLTRTPESVSWRGPVLYVADVEGEVFTVEKGLVRRLLPAPEGASGPAAVQPSRDGRMLFVARPAAGRVEIWNIGGGGDGP